MRPIPRNTVMALAAGRFVVGGGALVAPHTTGRLWGIDTGQGSASVYLARLFGVRAVAMAALVLMADGDNRRRQLQLGVAVDLVDAAAAAAAGRDGDLRRPTAVAACAAALVEAGLGVVSIVNAGRARARS